MRLVNFSRQPISRARTKNARRVFFSSVLVAVCQCTTAFADTSDPAAARGQLQQGYALKQQGKCEEAIPHFVESVRLDRQPKTLLNLGDCEEAIGKLAAAQTHFAEARDTARSLGVTPLKTIAEQRLGAVEKKTPKLTVRLAKDAPAESHVTRDGAELGSISLGVPLPIDPGRHTIAVRGGGMERQYDVTVSVAESKEIEVTPAGGQTMRAPTPVAAVPSAPAAPTISTPRTLSTSTGEPAPVEGPSGGRLALEYALTAVGVAGVAVGVGELLQLSNRKREMTVICPSDPCADATVRAHYEEVQGQAKTARTISFIGFAGGGVALASAAVLWLTTPRATNLAKERMTLLPTVGGGQIALEWRGTWQ